MGSLSIHSKFDSASCPASLPMWDDGVDSTPSVVPFRFDKEGCSLRRHCHVRRYRPF